MGKRRYITVLIMYEDGQLIPSIYPGTEALHGEVISYAFGDKLDVDDGEVVSRPSSLSQNTTEQQ